MKLKYSHLQNGHLVNSNFNAPKEMLDKVASDEVLLVDVRSAFEYFRGHLKKAKHIPIEHSNLFVDDLKEEQKPVIFYSNNGYRSRQVTRQMRRNGIEAYNGGSLDNLRNT